MKHFLLSLITLAMTAAAACAQGVQRFEIKVGDFDRLKVSNDINVEYVCDPDSAGLAVFYAPPQKGSSVIFTNKKSKLNVQVSTDDAISASAMPVVRVYSSRIEEVENVADSTLRVLSMGESKKIKLKLSDNGKIVANNLNCDRVEAQIVTGKGKIIVGGSCQKASLRCTGTGEIQADCLRAVDVNCMILGTGTIGCMVDGGKLVIKGSGTGKVYYKGQPAEIKSYQIGKIKAIPIQNTEPTEALETA